jgi:preprotein translocase subunit YajC
MSVILLIVLFVLAWVVLILPKQRELKRHNALVASLEVGDEVMSGSGLYGTIARIEGDVVYLEVAPGLELKLARRAIAARVAEPTEAAGPGELLEGDEVSEGWPSTVDADGEPVDELEPEVGESSPDEPGSELDAADADADDAGGRRGLD